MRWISLFHGSLDVVNDTHQGNLTELTEPRPRSHGKAERALDCRVHSLGHGALIVALFVDSGVVSVVVGREDPMLDQRSDAEITERFTE